MKLQRFEILLPLVYNDGTEIEKEKFEQTNEELLTQFGAVTFDSVIASGLWSYKGVLYQDQLIRLPTIPSQKDSTLSKNCNLPPPSLSFFRYFSILSLLGIGMNKVDKDMQKMIPPLPIQLCLGLITIGINTG